MSALKLRVLPKGTAMVPHYEAQHTVRKFHGWKHDASVGHPVLDPKTDQPMGTHRAGGFVRHSVLVPIELPDTTEYRRHLRDGDLWAFDAETAQEVGCAFDPNYGGEYDSADESEKAEH